MTAQEFVRSLRADGMSEEEIRRELRGAGYKTGRISKLLDSTRARGSADPPPADEAGPAAAPPRHVTNDLFSICQEDSSVSMDDVAASGSLALEEDKAGCLFCIGYVRSCMLVFHQCNNLRIGDIPRHPGHGKRHGRDRPPKALWKASALWWLGRSGRASMGAEDIDGIDAQYGCCRQGGCDVRDLWSCILLCQNVSLNVFFCIMFCQVLSWHQWRCRVIGQEALSFAKGFLLLRGASFPSPGLAEPQGKRQRVPNVFSATLNG